MNFQEAVKEIQLEISLATPLPPSGFYCAVAYCLPIIEAAAEIEAIGRVPVVESMKWEASR